MRVPRRHTISHGIVPIDAATRGHRSLPALVALPPEQHDLVAGSTPADSVTSTVIMSIDTAPTIGTRGRESARGHDRKSRIEPIGVAGRDHRDRPRRRPEAPAVANAFAGPQSLTATTRLVSDITGQRSSMPAAAARSRRAAGPAARRRTRRASRAAARRCWRRGEQRASGSGLRGRAARHACLEALALFAEDGTLRHVGGREMRVDGSS